MESVNLKEAIFCVNAKSCDVSVCAFNKKLCFGPASEDNTLKNLKYFEIRLNDITDFFCALFYIVKSFTTKTGSNGLLCSKNETVNYKWQTINDDSFNIQFIIFKNGVEEFKLELSILQFNDILFLISHIILHCLSISIKETYIINNIILLDLDQLLQFKNETTLLNFLNQHKLDFDLNFVEIHQFSLWIFYNLDIIIAIHNIKSLYNPSLAITHKNIDKMLSCH